MLETYEEYLKNRNKEDSKANWICWRIEIYGYSKEKALKRAESQYFPIPTVNQQQTVIGLNIRHLRKQEGLTQKKLTELLELNDNLLVCRWEKGLYIPDAIQTQKVADFFGVSVSKLLNYPFYNDKKG